MSRIFELFGYPLDSWSSAAASNRERAWCPFTDSECDGGGNRYLSAINLPEKPHLQRYFPGKEIVQAGVCSLRTKDGEQPWIVCPRRLLSLRGGASRDYQRIVKRELFRYSGIPSGTTLRAWSEVKMKVETLSDDEESKSFDYTFDYVLCGSDRVRLSDVSSLIGKNLNKTRKIAEENGFTLSQRGDVWIEDFPSDPIIIVEIMTSSTSGGDKKKRTQIGMAFEDAVIDPANHSGPGINYRQVWARMVSQLIVKSQVGLAWGGKTIWLLQDVLADYISCSTALDLKKFLATASNEVNILAFGYGETENPEKRTEEIITLAESNFYAGPISPPGSQGNTPAFVDIVKLGAPPPKQHLWKSLFLKAPSATMTMT